MAPVYGLAENAVGLAFPPPGRLPIIDRVDRETLGRRGVAEPARADDAHPLEIVAYQYDIVCNGVELASGAIRNHRPDIMYKAFAIAGYSAEEVELRFGGMLNAFKFGAPPHGGMAPGIDRIVMLLADTPNIREIVAFPMNQQARDLLMQAPAPVSLDRLRELHIRLDLPPARSANR